MFGGVGPSKTDVSATFFVGAFSKTMCFTMFGEGQPFQNARFGQAIRALFFQFLPVAKQRVLRCFGRLDPSETRVLMRSRFQNIAFYDVSCTGTLLKHAFRLLLQISCYAKRCFLQCLGKADPSETRVSAVFPWFS